MSEWSYQTCNYWLKNIRRIRRCLSLTATQLLVQAFVLARLDYCNDLYVGLPQQQLGRLQRLQNAAARLITCTPRQEHIQPVLMQLHWLRVPQRIILKILTLTFLAIHGKAPTYIMLTGRAAHLATWTTVDEQCNYTEAATFQNGSRQSCLCHCCTKAV